MFLTRGFIWTCPMCGQKQNRTVKLDEEFQTREIVYCHTDECEGVVVARYEVKLDAYISEIEPERKVTP